MSERNREAEEIQRKLDLILALTAYTAAVASYRPRKKSIGDRLWDLI